MLALFCWAYDIQYAWGEIVAKLCGTLLLFDDCKLRGRIVNLVRLWSSSIKLILAGAVSVSVAFCEPRAALERSWHLKIRLRAAMSLLLLVVHH